MATGLIAHVAAVALGLDFRDPLAVMLDQKIAIGTKPGGLLGVVEKRLPGRGVKRLAFNVTMVEDPQKELEKLIADPQAGDRAFSLSEARKFAGDFERRHGIGLDFDESSVLMAATVSAELGLSIPEYLDRVFQDHLEALQKLAGGKVRLPVSPQVLNRPGEAIAACLAACSAAS